MMRQQEESNGPIGASCSSGANCSVQLHHDDEDDQNDKDYSDYDDDDDYQVPLLLLRNI